MSPQAACCQYIVILCLTLLACTGTGHAQTTLEEAKQQQEKIIELLDLETYMAAEYAAALEIQRKVLAIHEQALGPEHPDTGKPLNVLARLYWGMGNRAASEPFYLRALAIYEKANNDERTAAILSNLALLYTDAGEYGKAEPLQLRALALAQKHFGSEHPAMVKYLSDLQRLYTEMREYQRAEAIAVRGMAVARKGFGPQDNMIADMASSLGMLYMHLSQYAKAEPLYLESLEIKEQRFGKTHIASAVALRRLGALYHKTGAYPKAERYLQRALTIQERASGPDHPDTARMLGRLGVLYYNMGHWAKAESLLQRAARIMEAQLGAEHPETADALDNLGAAYGDRGAYPKAEALHQRTLHIRQKILGSEHPDVAYSLLNVARVQAATGAYSAAAELQQRALAIRERALGPNHRLVAFALSELADLYRNTGEPAKAAPLLQRAVAIREAAQGPEHPSTAEELQSLGSLHRATGDYAKSEPFLRRALDIREKAFGPGALFTSYSIGQLAQLYFATGRELQAKQLQERSCSGLRRSLSSEHPDTASCLNTLAQMHWGTDGATQALPLFKETQAAQARYSLRLLRTGSEARKRAYLRTVGEDLATQVSFSVAVRDQQAIELGLLGVLQYKGLLQDAVSDGIARVRNNASASDRKLFDRLASVASQFSSLAYQTNNTLSGDLQRQRIDELNGEQQRLETELAKRSSELRQQLSPVTLSQVRASIPLDGVLIEWFRYQPYDPKDRGPRSQVGIAPRYAAYVVGRQGEAAVIDVGEAQAIDTLVGELQLALSKPERLDVKARSAALAQRLYQPLQPHLRPYRHLLVSADGALNLVPMAALLDERGRYLLERFEITYLTSGRDLLRFGFDQRRAGPPVVVAAPAYGKAMVRTNAPSAARTVRSAELDRSGLIFRPLRGALQEGKQVARLLGVASNDMLVADAAREETLKRLRGPRVLHIATHGFFLRDQSAATPALPENPLLRSGLALAGANARRSGPRDDGILTALELAHLDLQGTELVVLSACESGAGEVHTGDGVSGLRRALVLAGARAQLTSLWQIADLPTQELMVDYYQRLLRGKGRSAALREAQLAIVASRDRSHPYYWAAFMPIGDWRALEVHEQRKAKPADTATASAKPAPG